MSKDIVLTQTNLNEEGIKTQLTQNDLLEVLVSEVYDKRMAVITEVNNKAKELETRFSQLENDFKKQLAVKDFQKTGLNLDVEQLKTYVRFDNDIKSTRIKSIYLQEGKTTKIEISYGYYYCYSNIVKGTWEYVTYTEENGYKKTVEYKGEFNVKINTKPFEKLFKEIEEHNKRVEELYEQYKDLNLNYNSLAREIRVKFNKSLIVKGAPKLRAKIASSFGIELK